MDHCGLMFASGRDPRPKVFAQVDCLRRQWLLGDTVYMILHFARRQWVSRWSTETRDEQIVGIRKIIMMTYPLLHRFLITKWEKRHAGPSRGRPA